MVGQLFGENISINPARIFFKRAQILGVGSVSRAQLADVVALAARGIVTPQVSQILPLAEVARAHEIVEGGAAAGRSEEHPSELQSLMRISYAVVCLKKKKNKL